MHQTRHATSDFASSATHRVKRDQMTIAKMLAKNTVGHEDGHQVVRISLPKAVAKDTPKTKTVRKRTPKTKTAEKTA